MTWSCHFTHTVLPICENPTFSYISLIILLLYQRLEIKSEDRSKFQDYHKELEEHTKLVQQTRQLKHKQEREKSVEVIYVTFYKIPLTF